MSTHAERHRIDALMSKLSAWFSLLLLGLLPPFAAGQHWFEAFKDEASPAQLHQFLYAMPKGGDLHLHLGGSVFSEWYYKHALAQAENGYRYYVKRQINNCPGAAEEARQVPYLMLHITIDHLGYAALNECEQREYVPLETLDASQKKLWLNSLRLDKPHEGRDEFFERHWDRLGDLARNPYLVAEVLVENMRAFGEEGLVYIEPQVPIFGFINARGERFTPDEVLTIYLDRIAQPDAKRTGVDVRMQVSLLRFLNNAESMLKVLYKFAHKHEQVVAVNMVGREDNDKCYPLRFLDTLRELRKTHSGVRLSIHAGEVDEPNHHVRDTLLLGADRIGHGVNLITDPDTLLKMRHGPYLIEVNLISNLLLEYVEHYEQHPFPEYLRLGVPVALSTDDRGMWDSTMTDEFFVAVTEFDLSWSEVVTLSRNSLRYSFLPDAQKAAAIKVYDKRIEKFEQAVRRHGEKGYAQPPAIHRGFICRQYQLCGEVK